MPNSSESSNYVKQFFLIEKINQQDLGVEPIVPAAQVVVVRSLEDTHPK